MDSNAETVKRIADIVEGIVSGEVYIVDGEFVRAPDDASDEWFDDHESASLIDYFSNAYDITYKVRGHNGDAHVVGVSFCVAFGGPNIYVTESDVRLAWWGNSASWSLSEKAGDAMLDLADDLFSC